MVQQVFLVRYLVEFAYACPKICNAIAGLLIAECFALSAFGNFFGAILFCYWYCCVLFFNIL
jgi:hypothetical protein